MDVMDIFKPEAGILCLVSLRCISIQSRYEKR